MTSIINLEDLPQLVMDKITSFLNHTHLLTLEQVSRKLKSVVDAHFSFTDHFIIGSLPPIETVVGFDEGTAMDKKYLKGLLHTITRCGIRLKTIQITFIQPFCSADFLVFNYIMYLRHLFASAEMSEKCPNLEIIIGFPNMYFPILHATWFRKRKVLLDVADTKIYVNNILCQGGTCKLRSIIIGNTETEEEIESILNLYSNIEQIAVHDGNENLLKFLPKLIENGLKDLYINALPISLANLRKYCNVGKALRKLLISFEVSSNEHIASLKRLHVPKNVEFELHMMCYIDNIDHCFAQLSNNICNSIIVCEINGLGDCSLMTKLKNLQECWIVSLGQLKVMTEGFFPKLKRIHVVNTLCDQTSGCDKGTCDMQIFLRQILINRGNHLTFIRITCNDCILIDVPWKALKHCTAARIIEFERLVIKSPLSVTAEDVKVVCDLPNLQHYMFSIDQTQGEDDNCTPLRELMDTVVKEYVQFEHKYEYAKFGNYLHWFSLYRVHL